MVEKKAIKIGQKFIFEKPVSVKRLSSEEMVTIHPGTTGYVTGSNNIIVTDGLCAGQWVPVDTREYIVSGVDYDGMAEVVVTGLIKDGYELDRQAFIYVADYLRSIAIEQ